METPIVMTSMVSHLRLVLVSKMAICMQWCVFILWADLIVCFLVWQPLYNCAVLRIVSANAKVKEFSFLQTVLEHPNELTFFEGKCQRLDNSKIVFQEKGWDCYRFKIRCILCFAWMGFWPINTLLPISVYFIWRKVDAIRFLFQSTCLSFFCEDTCLSLWFCMTNIIY